MLWLASAKSEQSALRARNSKLASPPVSNGRTVSLARLSFSDSPVFRLLRSASTDFITPDVVPPCNSSAFFSTSTARGARFCRARLARAFLGFTRRGREPWPSMCPAAGCQKEKQAGVVQLG